MVTDGTNNVRVLFDANRKSGRSCGECSLCCKLLPMPVFQKAAGTRCEFQRFHKGCTIYHRRPSECQFWSCRWLMNEDTARLRRPDRSHYVVDIMPDFVTIVDNATGAATNIEVVQIWCDPDYPDAHRDPALREYLIRRAKEGIAALVRFDASRGLHLMAPQLCVDRQWHEIEGPSMGRERTTAERLAALAGGYRSSATSE